MIASTDRQFDRDHLAVIRGRTAIVSAPKLVEIVNQALRRLGYAGLMTAHGFRSTASTLLNGSKLWDSDVIEYALAHSDEDSIRSIYNRATYWQQRVDMMQWWSDLLDRLRAGES